MRCWSRKRSLARRSARGCTPGVQALVNRRCAEMFGKKGLDLTQHRRTILLRAELVVRIRDGYEPVRLPGALQSGVHVFGLLERHLGVRIAVEHQQGNVEFGRMQSG